MRNFDIKLDAEKNIVTINYYGTTHYRTLLQSLDDLFSLYIPKDVRIVFDFSEAESLLISYSQINNFRQGLRSIFPHRAVSKIAIINPPVDSWGGKICSSQPVVLNNDFHHFDLRCYGADQKNEAYQWV
jgi:hypothetical protein